MWSLDSDDMGTMMASSDGYQDDMLATAADLDDFQASAEMEACAPLDPYQQQLAYEVLFPGSEFQPTTATVETYLGYPTPAAEHVLPMQQQHWTPCQPQVPMPAVMPMQAPPMEYTQSAPPAMMMNDATMNMPTMKW